MDHTSIDIYLVIDTFLLLLIGIGPKIALVPFLEVTAAMDGATKALIVRKMLITAGVTAVILIGLGELLSRLLHFSTGSLSIAGGVILMIIAVTMVLGCTGLRIARADVAVFRWANRVSDHLDESRMLVTEKIFGFVLAALAVQLALDGLDSLGLIHVSGH
jgi:multiple antibiotic resistance protein